MRWQLLIETGCHGNGRDQFRRIIGLNLQRCQTHRNSKMHLTAVPNERPNWTCTSFAYGASVTQVFRPALLIHRVTIPATNLHIWNSPVLWLFSLFRMLISSNEAFLVGMNWPGRFVVAEVVSVVGVVGVVDIVDTDGRYVILQADWCSKMRPRFTQFAILLLFAKASRRRRPR